MRPKFLRMSVVACLTAGLLAPIGASAVDAQYRAINFRDDKDALPGTVMYWSTASGVSTACELGFMDKNCDVKTATLIVNNFLPLCESEKVLDCIESVAWKKDDGSYVVGKYTKIRGSNWDEYAFARNEALRVNSPTLPQIFTFEGLSHSKGNLFAVTAHVKAVITKGVTADPEISLVILPVYQVSGLDPENDAECITANGADVDSVCYKIADITTPYRVKLTLKLGSRPQGWMAGRVIDPSITFTAPADPEKRTSAVIEGTSMKVQTIDRTYLASDTTATAQWNIVASAINDARAPWSATASTVFPLPPTNIDIFTKVVAAQLSANPKATASFDIADSLKSLWRVDLKPKGRADGLASCDSTEFQGFVSSNAMVYKTALPNFDKNTGSLDYSVASPHFEPDGKTEFKGRYDLLVATPFARCTWGLKSGELPSKDAATITVTKSDGTTQTILSEVSLDDQYFRFTAQGFTFSQAKLSIKLKPKEAITPAPIPSAPAATPVATSAPAAPALAKSTTITCVKGKTTKKVTAAKPLCPAGFKKK